MSYGVYYQNLVKAVVRLARECHALRIVANQRDCPTETADLAEAILCGLRRCLRRMRQSEAFIGLPGKAL